MSEAELQRALLERLNLLPGCWCWRSNTGVARGHVRFGLPGQGDISGLLSPHGRRLEVEVKDAKGKQNPAQVEFQRRIEERGGLYVLARDVDQALVEVRAALGSGEIRRSA